MRKIKQVMINNYFAEKSDTNKVRFTMNIIIQNNYRSRFSQNVLSTLKLRVFQVLKFDVCKTIII